MAKSKSKPKAKSKPETSLSLQPAVFVPTARKAAGKALAMRKRGQARIRYAKKPTKKDGNPFFALRVPRSLLRAFKAHARKQKTTTTVLVREYMGKCTGVEVEDGAEQ